MAAKTVDAYINRLKGWQRDAAAEIRDLVLSAAPKATVSIKWAQPVFEQNGPFAYLKAFGGFINFGFWRGVDLDDPKRLLEGTGAKMRHVKVTGLEEVKPADFKRLVKQAVKLNEAGGNPTKRKE